ncbi:uncharacterized protein LOC124140564 isoform X2 [Haliotis rufescens]|uniref:uncharacterized protein LOC124140564 isoform X2 n=1 Tax=Haliotis rufescens TaxID=6454 RepID=UPI00201E77A1|nr:uncharacterized protein LOC124140564 isoform X2 [Haliotis rufescens]
MCAAGNKPDTFEFVARMGRLSFVTDGDEKKEDSKVPLSFIIPTPPNRAKGRDKLGRNQRAAKSVDIDIGGYDERKSQGEFSSHRNDSDIRRGKKGKSEQGEFSSQSNDSDIRRGKKGKSHQGLSRRSSDDVLFRLRENRKKHEQDLARKHAEQHPVNETVREPHLYVRRATNHVS